MNITRSTVLAGAVLALMLAGCQKPTDNPKPVAQSSGMSGTSGSSGSPSASSTSGSSGSSDKSVAAPPSAVPPSDATMKPDGSAKGSGNASTPTQAHPTDLSKSEEQSTMPHSGQVNNHSTPQSSGK